MRRLRYTGDTHGMFSDNNLPRGVTSMRKPASFYSDFIGESPLSERTDMNAGGEWQTFWALQPRRD